MNKDEVNITKQDIIDFKNCLYDTCTVCNPIKMNKCRIIAKERRANDNENNN